MENESGSSSPTASGTLCGWVLVGELRFGSRTPSYLPETFPRVSVQNFVRLGPGRGAEGGRLLNSTGETQSKFVSNEFGSSALPPLTGLPPDPIEKKRSGSRRRATSVGLKLCSFVSECDLSSALPTRPRIARSCGRRDARGAGESTLSERSPEHALRGELLARPLRSH